MGTDREYPLKFKSIYFQLRAKDLERAKKFYEDVFNLEVTWYMSPEAGWCELRLPGTGSRIGLNALGEGEVVDPNWGKLTMEVEDLEGAKEYLEGKGVETTEIVDVPGMVSYFGLVDSEGNQLQMVSDPRVEG
jgi:predicted enzyme related to lactoylglutathione lyase